MNNRIISAADMMLQAANIGTSEANEICSVWKKVVSGIHSSKYESEVSERRMPIGERLAGNTRVIDLKNGVLLVETDHPGWIQYLKMYQKFIINGLKMNLPKLKISSLAFRVSGEKVSLSESYENQLAKERKEMAAKLEKQEKELKKYDKGSENTEKRENKLPPELLAKFDSIRNSMLDLSQE
ncbi:Protein of unknown function [Treponema bryantii]|uniref:DUF721 domain-containing protein n=1 Tax=Treponema bryantii TaxID=163 RepID=A0A1H9H656_9SPIR|nr:DciA family protein [Treponema bryantii]SEQ57836.1 Protein of unknown function [Treponema bryantii]